MESLNKVCDVSTINGTDDCETLFRDWCVALVQMNCGKIIENRLQPLAFQIFLPVRKEIHRCRDRKTD